MLVYATVKVRKERPFVVSRRFFRPAEVAAAFVASLLQPTSVSKAAPQRAQITPKALCKAPLLCRLVFGGQEPLAV